MMLYKDDEIRRSDAIKAVENVSKNYTKEGDREWHPHIDFIIQALIQVPSVSPKHGEPQSDENCDYCKMAHKYWYEHCDTCKQKPKTEAQTTDYCDICNHKGCDNCIADGSDPYCIPSQYEPQTERSNDDV